MVDVSEIAGKIIDKVVVEAELVGRVLDGDYSAVYELISEVIVQGIERGELMLPEHLAKEDEW